MFSKTTVLIISLFVLMAGGWGYSETEEALADIKIAKSPVFTEAKIVESDLYSHTKKRSTTVTYSIVYSFLADNQEIKRKVSLVNESGKNAVEKGVLDVVYYKENPQLNKLTTNYDSQANMLNLILDLLKLSLFSLVMAVIAGIILAFKFGWLRKSEPVAQN